jgi:hypothetical protein
MIQFETLGLTINSVYVRHLREDGYPPSIDGRTVTEYLSINELLNRIFAGNSPPQEIERYEANILNAVRSADTERINEIIKALDRMYSEKVRKMEIPNSVRKYYDPHMAHLGNVGPVSSFSETSKREKAREDERMRMMMQMPSMYGSYGVTGRGDVIRGLVDTDPAPTKKKKEEKDDSDEIYYLLT